MLQHYPSNKLPINEHHGPSTHEVATSMMHSTTSDHQCVACR